MNKTTKLRALNEARNKAKFAKDANKKANKYTSIFWGQQEKFYNKKVKDYE